MDRLTQGKQLMINDELTSTNKKVRLVMQGDGNLVLYRTDNGYTLWSTGTSNKSVHRAVMRADGNFICCDRDGTVLWASRTSGHPSAELVLRDDGNLVIHGSRNVPLWASDTAQDWNARTLLPHHTDLGEGRHVVRTADVNVTADQVGMSDQLTSTNKSTGCGYPHRGLADTGSIEKRAFPEPVSRAPGWLAVLGREPPRPRWLRGWEHAWWLAVGAVCFGAFMGQLDASIVVLTYRGLGAEFHAPLAGVQWVSLSYLLALTAFLVPVGRLSDVRGRKLTYLYGFVVFTVASAACGLAPSLGALVAFRVVQAGGAAMLQANSVALVTTSAPIPRRRAALGVQAAAQAIGLALGPTAGGVLVSTVGWRWVFDINVPVGLVAVVAGVYFLPRTRQRSFTVGWDLPGTLLLATATTSLLLAISVISGLALPDWAAIVLVVVALSTAAGFLVRQRHAAAPLVDLALLRNSHITTGLLGGLCGYLVLFGALVLIPVLFTSAGASELHAGLILTALPAGFVFATAIAERVLPRRWTDAPRAILGAALGVAALGGLVLVLARTPLPTPRVVLLVALLGIALGVFMPANNSLLMGAIPGHAAATGGGLINMTRSLGTALGVALVTLTFSTSLGYLPHGPRTAALVLAAAAVVALASTRGTPPKPSPGP